MRRRSSSAAWTMRARDAATSASRSRRAISWRRRSISAAARAAKIVSAATSSSLASIRRRERTPRWPMYVPPIPRIAIAR